MSESGPEYDFSNYNPKDPWGFPPERLIWFAEEAGKVFKVSRNKLIRVHPHPDARYVAFHELHYATFTFSVFAYMIREKGLDKDWWNGLEGFAGKFDIHTVKFNNIGLRGNLSYTFISTLAKQVEMLFRQILHFMSRESSEEKALSLKQVYQEMLTRTGLESYMSLFQLILVVRDSQTYNGKFCPANRKDLSLTYQKKTFSFQDEAEIDPQEFGFTDMWAFILFLVEETDHLLNEVIASPFVSTIPFIKTRHVG